MFGLPVSYVRCHRNYPPLPLLHTKNNMNFAELLDEHNIPYAQPGHRHYRKGWVNFDCSHCTPHSGQYYMGFNTRGGYVNCWYCGKHGLAATLAALFNTPYSTAAQLAKGLAREYLPTEGPKLAKLVLPPCKLGPLLLPHQRYLASRGLVPAQMAQLWGLQGIGLAGHNLAWRIYIPVHRYGKQISWTTRSIAPGAALRYKGAGEAAEAYPSKAWLYGLDYCRGAVVVCEGPGDVWAGGPGFAATMGTTYTPAQVALIAQYPVRVVCYDAEVTAQQRAKKLCDELAIYPGQTTNVVLDTGKDPGSANPKELHQLRKVFLE